MFKPIKTPAQPPEKPPTTKGRVNVKGYMRGDEVIDPHTSIHIVKVGEVAKHPLKKAEEEAITPRTQPAEGLKEQVSAHIQNVQGTLSQMEKVVKDHVKDPKLFEEADKNINKMIERTNLEEYPLHLMKTIGLSKNEASLEYRFHYSDTEGTTDREYGPHGYLDLNSFLSKCADGDLSSYSPEHAAQLWQMYKKTQDVLDKMPKATTMLYRGESGKHTIPDLKENDLITTEGFVFTSKSFEEAFNYVTGDTSINPGVMYMIEAKSAADVPNNHTVAGSHSIFNPYSSVFQVVDNKMGALEIPDPDNPEKSISKNMRIIRLIELDAKEMNLKGIKKESITTGHIIPEEQTEPSKPNTSRRGYRISSYEMLGGKKDAATVERIDAIQKGGGMTSEQFEAISRSYGVINSLYPQQLYYLAKGNFQPEQIMSMVHKYKYFTPEHIYAVSQVQDKLTSEHLDELPRGNFSPDQIRMIAAMGMTASQIKSKTNAFLPKRAPSKKDKPPSIVIEAMKPKAIIPLKKDAISSKEFTKLHPQSSKARDEGIQTIQNSGGMTRKQASAIKNFDLSSDHLITLTKANFKPDVISILTGSMRHVIKLEEINALAKGSDFLTGTQADEIISRGFTPEQIDIIIKNKYTLNDIRRSGEGDEFKPRVTLKPKRIVKTKLKPAI